MVMREHGDDEACFVCMAPLRSALYIPLQEDYLGDTVSLFKNTLMIHGCFTYYCVCTACAEQYVRLWGRTFRHLLRREVQGR